jgi:hypothetical protein
VIFYGLHGLGILTAHSDFGVAAGYVNSGQRVYHGRGNSTAFLGLVGKTNLIVGTTVWVCSRPEVLQASDLSGQASGQILSLWMAGRWLPFSPDFGGCFGQ